MKEDIRFGYRIRGEYLRPLTEYAYRKKTDFIVVHCAATTASEDIGADEIREWHVHDRGWLDIGYHFVIRRDGVLERGRPPMAVPSDVQGHNYDSLGICLVGGADKHGKGENNFTPEQWKSLNFLVHEASRAYPTAQILGHRDFPGVKKECPSFDVRTWFLAAPPVELGLPVDGETVSGELFQ